MRSGIFAVIIWIVGAIGASANSKDMQAVIDSQISAFQQDDFAKALEYASPVLQQYFRTPENFQRMVTQGYPMVWRPDTVRYLENRTEDGVHFQRVMIKDQQGRFHVLEYRMLDVDGEWRINGVRILDAAEFTA